MPESDNFETLLEVVDSLSHEDEDANPEELFMLRPVGEFNLNLFNAPWVEEHYSRVAGYKRSASTGGRRAEHIPGSRAQSRELSAHMVVNDSESDSIALASRHATKRRRVLSPSPAPQGDQRGKVRKL